MIEGLMDKKDYLYKKPPLRSKKARLNKNKGLLDGYKILNP